jgi:hypothetical protein
MGRDDRERELNKQADGRSRVGIRLRNGDRRSEMEVAAFNLQCMMRRGKKQAASGQPCRPAERIRLIMRVRACF